MTFPYNVKFWMIILAPSSPSRDVTMHRVLQNFYDKTNSEEPLMAWQKNGTNCSQRLAQVGKSFLKLKNNKNRLRHPPFFTLMLIPSVSSVR